MNKSRHKVTNRICTCHCVVCIYFLCMPFFQALLGDRYGYRPIPAEVSVEELETLMDEAKAIDHPKQDLLKTWYIKDENAQPPLYTLQVGDFITVYTHICKRNLCVLPTSVLFINWFVFLLAYLHPHSQFVDHFKKTCCIKPSNHKSNQTPNMTCCVC